MARLARVRSISKGRTVLYALGAAAIVLLLVAGLAFVNTVSVSRVADNASALHWTNATIGNSALTRAGLVQAVTFAELGEADLVEAADTDFAMEQLALSFEDLERLASIGEDHASHEELVAFLAEVSAAVDDLTDGRVEAAKTAAITEVEEAHLALTATLETQQGEILRAIEDNDEAGRALNGWILFILTVAVPGSAVAVYFVVARRQVREIRERNKIELDAERTISRAKDSFIAGLSHELRTPLTSIYGFAEVLADSVVTGPEATAETAQIIANEAAEMGRMVDDLLAASRLESTGVEVDLGSTSVDDVVQSAILPFERAGLKVAWEGTSATALADAARLRHVIVNLLSNAARHGGSNVGVEVVAEEETVDVEVWDDGQGVPEDHEKRMFDRFVHDGSAPLLTGSIGLGLAVAARLTALMNGALQYRRFGGKTYFVVSLPAPVSDDISEESHALVGEPAPS